MSGGSKFGPEWRSFSQLVDIGVTRGWLDKMIQEWERDVRRGGAGGASEGLLWKVYRPESAPTAPSIATVAALSGEFPWLDGEHLYDWFILGPTWQTEQAREVVRALEGMDEHKSRLEHG